MAVTGTGAATMKISFDVECTPAEARTFLGLPDLTALHELYLNKMKDFATDGLSPADFDRMTKAWLPQMTEGLETWRQAMFSTVRAKVD